jgi:hypothetical protein
MMTVKKYFPYKDIPLGKRDPDAENSNMGVNS